MCFFFFLFIYGAIFCELQNAHNVNVGMNELHNVIEENGGAFHLRYILSRKIQLLH